MTPRWRVFAIDVECGSGSGHHRVPAGDPVHVVGVAIRRCVAHSSVPVNDAEVDADRLAIEASRAKASTPYTPGPVTRVSIARPMVPFKAIAKKLPFDHRKVAAGDRER